MNATTRWTWRGRLLARAQRLRHRQLGFALYEPARRPGVPTRVANAHARFEHEARQALREWLMV